MNSDQQKFNAADATIKGTFWSYVSHISGKLMVFISTIVLARVLMKDEFGVAAYAVVAIGFLEVLKDLGIHQALIYHKRTPESTNAGFWLGLIIAIALFGLTWFLAPLAGAFFREERATSMTRVLALTFPLNALSNVHDALLRKELAFGKKLIPDVVRSISKGLISIVLALLGFGAWSLIYGQVAGMAIAVIAYWKISSWRPSLHMNLKAGRPLLDYGLAVVLINAVGILLLNVDYLFVGRFMGAVALGIYTLSFRAPDLLIRQFYEVLGKVIFPVYSKMRTDIQSLSESFLTTMRYVSMMTLPMGVGLALISKPFVLTVFSDKWIEAIPVMPAIAIYTLLRSLMFSVGDVYKAQGRLSILIKLSVLQLVMLVPALWWVTTSFGTLTAVAWTMTLVAFIHTAVKFIVAGKIMRTPLRDLAAALEPGALGTIVMAFGVLVVLRSSSTLPAPVQLFSALVTGVLFYGLALWWFRRDVVLIAGNKLIAVIQQR